MKALILGDVCPSKVTREDYAKKETEKLFGDFIDVMRSSEFTFVNLECAITESNEKIKKFGPHLKAPIETADVLKALNVTVCGLSNNHVFDFGTSGAVDTIKALESLGIDCTGFGNSYEDSRKDYVFEKGGERICVIAVCEHEFSGALSNRMGSRTFDECDTIEDITKARKSSDRVIVCYHGGKEYSKFPSPRLRKVCRAMVRAGADVVLCQHSHCIGSYEKFEGAHILYGQGNFNFVSHTNLECWHSSLAVIYDTKSGEIEFIPLQENEYGIQLAKGEDAEKIMREFRERNSELENGKWLERWHDFCIDVKDEYIQGVAAAALPDSSEEDNALFSQLLNCEAHNDVLRELFKTWNETNCVEKNCD